MAAVQFRHCGSRTGAPLPPTVHRQIPPFAGPVEPGVPAAAYCGHRPPVVGRPWFQGSQGENRNELAV